MAAPRVGAVLSLVVLGALQDRWSREALLWFSAKATPLLLILFCLSRHLWLSIMLLGLFGGMQIIFRTVSRLIIQVETPRELLLRKFSAISTAASRCAGLSVPMTKASINGWLSTNSIAGRASR